MNKPIGEVVGKILDFPHPNLSYENRMKFENAFYTELATRSDFQTLDDGANAVRGRYLLEFNTDKPDDELLKFATAAYLKAKKTWRQYPKL